MSTMGLGLQNHLGPLKLPLLGHRLSLCVEQLRGLFFSSPGSDSGQPLSLQLHKNTMCSSSLNLGASHISSHQLAAVLLGLPQTPNPSLHGVRGAGRVSFFQLSTLGSKDTSCPCSSSLCTSKAQHLLDCLRTLQLQNAEQLWYLFSSEDLKDSSSSAARIIQSSSNHS